VVMSAKNRLAYALVLAATLVAAVVVVRLIPPDVEVDDYLDSVVTGRRPLADMVCSAALAHVDSFEADVTAQRKKLGVSGDEWHPLRGTRTYVSIEWTGDDGPVRTSIPVVQEAGVARVCPNAPDWMGTPR
jgi:hypothetical protein